MAEEEEETVTGAVNLTITTTTIEQTPSLRFEVFQTSDSSRQMVSLQQMWRNIETGEVEWRDVEFVLKSESGDERAMGPFNLLL